MPATNFASFDMDGPLDAAPPWSSAQSQNPHRKRRGCLCVLVLCSIVFAFGIGKLYARWTTHEHKGCESGQDGLTYDDGFQGCYDRCFPTCAGEKWLCSDGKWVDKGGCLAAKKNTTFSDGQCKGDDGNLYDKGFKACYDHCHPACKGHKWLCWWSNWVDKGKCTHNSTADSDSGQCMDARGVMYDQGFKACYDECYPACQGKRWICWWSNWVPKGECVPKGNTSSSGQCLAAGGFMVDQGYKACYNHCETACQGQKWICWWANWVSKGQCDTSYSRSSLA